MKKILSAVLGTVALVVGSVFAATPAQAYSNLRSTGTCNLLGTVWNITDLYHYDYATGAAQSYGWRVSRASGTGWLKTTTVSWLEPPANRTVQLGAWNASGTGSPTTNTLDIPFYELPIWQSSQTIRVKIVSPTSASGDVSTTCLVTVT